MKLEALDKHFRAAHLNVIDLVEEESPDLEKEHEVMDKHEEDVTSASLRLRALLKATPSSSDATRPIPSKNVLQNLARSYKILQDVSRNSKTKILYVRSCKILQDLTRFLEKMKSMRLPSQDIIHLTGYI